MLEHASSETKREVEQYLFADVRQWRNEALVSRLRAKEIEAAEAPGSAVSLRERWAYCFAKELSEEDKKRIHLDQFLWHVFSYGKRTCMKNELAVKAFDCAAKDKCYIFYQNAEFALFVTNAAGLTAADLEHEQDVYVVDHEWKWTYAKTHESHCGPYFCLG
ncbi:DUF4275 family protein [Paenibacillus sp. IB182493]|uniref:DUF4275 family protein n=2 Tax=Paenibacillus arenilitoris TaxID=2772299 RepID=A0A927H3S5_9BACL|nr:DUF4275 family protein [Paenibacillus arenilitoris]